MYVSKDSADLSYLKVSIVTLILMAIVCCPFLYGIDQDEENAKEEKRYFGLSIGGGVFSLKGNE